MPELSKRFLKLWQSVGAVGDPRIPFADLQARYSEPWRAYHTLVHIEAMFAEYDQVCHFDFGNDSVAVEFAIWYHDAVYHPRDKENERKSASLFDIATIDRKSVV